MKTKLNQLLSQEVLSREEAYSILCSIGSGEVNSAQMAAFMSVYRLREITLDELRGFRTALLELALPVNLDSDNAIDLCGTGGDGRNSFNISTLSCFVVAACGGRVIKHGNYGVSSVSGSSTVLEKLGYKFTSDSSSLARSLDESGVCFLHAPLFHTALKHVAETRKNLGTRTFFNMLGPLVNPAKPSHRLTGVFSNELLRKYQYLLQETNEVYTLVHSDDGFDEISLTAPVKLVTNFAGKVYSPREFGLDKLSADQLFGGHTADEAAKIFRNILEGNGTKAQNDVVAVNSAAALFTLGKADSIQSGIQLAQEALLSGRAKTQFNKFMEAATLAKA
jgi:anthranilate phosphoribosyltransferase